MSSSWIIISWGPQRIAYTSYMCIYEYWVNNLQFTIKRNIYELTRTNFIISILVKTLSPHASFRSRLLFVWDPHTLQILLLVITFVVRSMHFVVFSFPIYIKVHLQGILKMLEHRNGDRVAPKVRDKSIRIRNKILEFVLSILFHVETKNDSRFFSYSDSLFTTYFLLHRLSAFDFNVRLVNKI